MAVDRKWHTKLKLIVDAAVKQSGFWPIDPAPLVNKALKGERAPKRTELAQKEVRREIGCKLRRWRDALPLIPGLLDIHIREWDRYIEARWPLPKLARPDTPKEERA